MSKTIYPVLLLAGERPGGNALSQHFNTESGALVPLGDQTLLQRVLQTVKHAQRIDGGYLLGPDAATRERHPQIDRWCHDAGLKWRAPAVTPASSCCDALRDTALTRAIITTADHALLQPDMLDAFAAQVQAATAQGADFVAGLVPYARVQEEFPDNRRTLLRLRGGPYCGANLFAVTSTRGVRIFELWRRMEALRKQPWRMAQQLGFGTLCRYVAGQLSLDQACARVGRLADANVQAQIVPWARAAVDIDSLDDWRLADRLLRD